MLSIVDYPYFQPQYPDGTMPEGLFSFQVFKSEQEAIDWMEMHLDADEKSETIEIREYANDDIEGVVMIDSSGNPTMKIEEVPTDGISNLICDEVLHNVYSLNDLYTPKMENETQQAYEDRVYTKANDLVNQAIELIEEENDYDFSSYGGNPDVDWYDEARFDAVQTVLRWVTERQ